MARRILWCAHRFLALSCDTQLSFCACRKRHIQSRTSEATTSVSSPISLYIQADLTGTHCLPLLFTARDVFLGFITTTNETLPETGAPLPPSNNTIESVLAGRTWAEALSGMYYVKPNYVGRSSHMCNAGFIVLPSQRGLKIGLALGRSYLHFAPQLGMHILTWCMNRDPKISLIC